MQSIQIRSSETLRPCQMIYCFVPVLLRSLRSTQASFLYSVRACPETCPEESIGGSCDRVNWPGALRAANLRVDTLTSSSFYAFFDVFAYAFWPTLLALLLINNNHQSLCYFNAPNTHTPTSRGFGVLGGLRPLILTMI